jgi:hypothetical protein
MLTYQLRPRFIGVIGSTMPTFPGEAIVNFYLRPLQAFGEANEGGRTVIQHSTPKICFNMNNAQAYSDTGGALAPLEWVIESNTITLKGSKLTIREQCSDIDTLGSLIDSISFVLPSILALEFADPPYIEHVDGSIDGIEFQWALKQLEVPVLVTTKERLEKAFALSYADISLVGAPHRRRLLAALGYFHVGARLLREAKTAGEFMSEALLNFSKVVETIYGTKRETVKEELKKLRYTREEIERDFFTILDLRNSMDVGHPGIALMTVKQLSTIHWFADRTERVMSEFLKRILGAIRDGIHDVPARKAGPPDATTLKVLGNLERIRHQQTNT